jgi:hypothetical protein
LESLSEEDEAAETDEDDEAEAGEDDDAHAVDAIVDSLDGPAFKSDRASKRRKIKIVTKRNQNKYNEPTSVPATIWQTRFVEIFACEVLVNFVSPAFIFLFVN